LPPLGENPDERETIPSFIAAVDAILRQPRRVMYQLRQPGAGRLMLIMLMVAATCSLLYGVVVGTFSMGTQLWAAPAKVAGGLLLAAMICLPSLYVFTCLSGSQARLAEMCGLLAGLMMLMSILLVGFAPVAWLFTQSTESVVWMGSLHLALWFISAFFGVRFSRSGFFALPGPVECRTEHLDRYLRVSRRANDDGTATLGGDGDYFPSGREKVLSILLAGVLDSPRPGGRGIARVERWQPLLIARPATHKNMLAKALDVASIDWFLRTDSHGLHAWLTRRGSRLVWFCVLAIVAGSGFYGAVMGSWWAPLQSFFVAINSLCSFCLRRWGMVCSMGCWRRCSGSG
jgi:hypothetical protein